MNPVPKKRRQRRDPAKTGSGQISKTVYFYADEHELIKSAADQLGISVSAYVVRAAIDAASRPTKK
jgi:uncharacterized protein (DUF1778 family)